MSALDKKSLDVIKKTYPEGTKVEAIRVKNIPKGTRGVVWQVKSDGDISVVWSNGYMTDVERCNESVKLVVEGMCLLGSGACYEGNCKECGWNEKVHKERVQKIHNGEMVEKRDGVMTLRVKKSLVSVG